MTDSAITARLGNLDDLEPVVQIDKSHYDSNPIDTHEMFKRRIANTVGWFWVAEQNGQVVGFLFMMPTSKGPNDFVSWEDSTADGTADTVDANGAWAYGISFEVLKGFGNADAVEEALFIPGLTQCGEAGKQPYLCSRMPGFAMAVRLDKYPNTQAGAEDYAETGNDRLLARFNNRGWKAGPVVPDAMKDDPKSLGWGRVFEAVLLD